jgi:hypothetical protein
VVGHFLKKIETLPMNEFEFEFLVFNATFSNISATCISWHIALYTLYVGSGGPGGSMS